MKIAWQFPRRLKLFTILVINLDFLNQIWYNDSMQICFRTNQLAKICNKASQARKKLGKDSALKLQQRLAQIHAAENLGVLTTFPVPGRCHPLKGKRSHQYAMDLKHPWRLVFEPIDGESGWKEDDKIIENRVEEIRIVEITDYH